MVWFEPFSDRGIARDGLCGLCGEFGPLSDTHIPPRGTGNHGAMRRLGLDRNTSELVHSRPRDGGGRGYFLCERCNNLTGAWDEELIVFVDVVRHAILTSDLDADGVRLQMSRQARLGRVIRSVLAGFFAIDDGLRAAYPRVAESILSGSPRALDSGLRLGAAATLDRRFFASGQRGGVQADLARGSVTALPLGVIHVPPLSFVLYEGGALPLHSEIGSWLRYGTEDIAAGVEVDLLFVTLDQHPARIPVGSDSYVLGSKASELTAWREHLLPGDEPEGIGD